MPTNLGFNSAKSKRTLTPQKEIVRMMIGAKLRNSGKFCLRELGVYLSM
jgi:hypothetical protein